MVVMMSWGPSFSARIDLLFFMFIDRVTLYLAFTPF